jgi:acetolactate synthase-1/2/3 large subunit
MGYGLPAAVAAAITHPTRQVVCVAGDGDLLMTAQELATAAHVGASLTVLVVNNAAYGTIRTHQERRYPGREIATALTNPDFVRLAEAFGGVGTRVSSTDEALGALAVGVTSPGLHLVDLVT